MTAGEVFAATARPAFEALRAEVARDGHDVSPARAVAAWEGTAAVLRSLAPTAAPDDARALVGALRQQGVCTLDEAHAFIDLEAMAARMAAEPAVTWPAGEHVRDLVARAEQSLARVVRTAASREAAAPLEAEYARAAARPPADAAGSGGVASSIHAPASPSAATAPGATPPAADASASAARAGSGRSSRFVVALVVGCLVVAGVAALLLSGVGRGDAMSEGIAAYEAGQRMVARLAFERAAGDEPSDARPFVYLGRLAREDGDLPQARRLLEQAVQRDPGNPLAHRELASALLADGQPELARRFYVRSLAIDPTDRLAQGFLGCALARLGRADEARRWLDRAGPGDWSACAGVLPPPTGRP